MSGASQESIPSLIHAISGSSGGVLAMLLTYPLITISTHAQTENKITKDENGKEVKTEVKNKNKTFGAFQKVFRNHGFAGLYSGLESALIGIGLTNFVYYYFYEFTKKLIMRKNKKANLSTIQSMLTGCIAGCITVISTNPVWVANTRATVLHKEHKDLNTLQIIMSIMKEKNGLKQLFNGVLPALVLVLNPIIQYSIFEQFKNVLVRRNKKVGPTDAFFVGALGKLIATGLTYPYITLKARMHLHDKDERKTMIQLIKEILEEEGARGFYNGMSVKLTQSIATAAFLFYFKEQLVGANYKIYKLLKTHAK